MMALQLVLSDCADLLSKKQFTLHTIMQLLPQLIFDGQNNRTKVVLKQIPQIVEYSFVLQYSNTIYVIRLFVCNHVGLYVRV